MSASIRLPRFFVSQPLVEGSLLLDGDEAHHLMHVLRLGPGREVTLFDGSGCEATATVEKLGRHEVRLTAIPAIAWSRENAVPVAIAVSLPKGDRQRVLVEKLTELGVQRMIPLVTRRGVAQPTGAVLERLQKGVIAASRQCGRNRLMEISPPETLAGLLDKGNSVGQGWYAHPAASGSPLRPPDGGAGTTVAIGPEGGFDDAELEDFVRAGWRPAWLGAAVLRVETAAIAAAAQLVVLPEGNPSQAAVG